MKKLQKVCITIEVISGSLAMIGLLLSFIYPIALLLSAIGIAIMMSAFTVLTVHTLSEIKKFIKRN